MVFEYVLAEVLNKILGQYVSNFDKNKLKLGIWGGDLVLYDLKLRENALDPLDLPVQLSSGFLKKLVLKIPWKNLYSQPVVAQIEDLFILVTPKKSVPFDAQKEEDYEFQSKQAALLNVEKAHQLAKDSTPTDKSFAEKLTARIINNLQIKISNVHFRYEDNVTTKFAFALGVTLYELDIHTTNMNWEKSYMADEAAQSFKVAQLNSFSVYMNCHTELLQRKNFEEIRQCLIENIIRKGLDLPNTYILGPISLIAKLKLNMNPETNTQPFILPKIALDINVDKLNIGITKSQFQNLLQLGDSINRMQLGIPYRKYRPFDIPYKGNYKLWWKFAITAVLENVTKKHNEWKWIYISAHLVTCKAYAKAFKEKKLSKKVSPAIEATCMECEKKLDLFNLHLIRNRVYIEVEYIQKENEENSKNASWLSGWFTKTEDTDQSDSLDLRKKFGSAMNTEEKQKIYKAIGYQENSAQIYMPTSYEAIKMQFTLLALEIGVFNDEKLADSKEEILSTVKYTPTTIMLLNFSKVTCNVTQRPSANSVKVVAGVYSMSLTGLENEDTKHTLIESLLKSSDENLLDISFETNPSDKLCDKRLIVGSRPLKITYDSKTIFAVMQIFKPYETVNISNIESVAAEKLMNFKATSATGMQHILSQHEILDVDIQCMPNILLIPINGLYVKDKCSMIVLSLGHLSVKSEYRPSKDVTTVSGLHEAGLTRAEILSEVMRQAYDKYIIAIEDIQVLVVKPSENWYAILIDGIKCDMHIVRPLSITVNVSVCAIENDIRLPKIKVLITFPHLAIEITEERILEAYKIAMSIQPPKEEKLVDSSPIGSLIKKSTSRLSVLFEVDKPRESVKPPPKLEESLELVEYIDLEMKFLLNEICVTLLKPITKKSFGSVDNEEDEFEDTSPEHCIRPIDNLEDPLVSPIDNVEDQFEDTFSQAQFIPNENDFIVSFKIIHLELNLIKRFYDLSANLKLGAIQLEENAGEDIADGKLTVIDTPSYSKDAEFLLLLSYTMVEKTSPEFTSKRSSTQQLIQINFSTLSIMLHQERILNLKEIALGILQNIEELDRKFKVQERDRYANAGGGDMLLFSSRESKPLINLKLDKKRNMVIVESIKIKIIAQMQQLSIGLATNQGTLSFFKIDQLIVNLVQKVSYDEISVSLQNVTVNDVDKTSAHPIILSSCGKDAFSCQVVIYHKDNKTYYKNEDDINLNVSIGCVKIIFLNKYVSSIVGFMNNFQTVQQKLADASAAAADAAKQNVVEAYEKATRLKFNIDIKAPIIYVPVHSKSKRGIALDLGSLKLTNVITDIVVEDNERSPAVLDEIKLNLKDIKILNVVIENITDCCIEEPDESAIENILDPINCDIIVNRNLSSSWYQEKSDLDISVYCQSIILNLMSEDYKLILLILEKNLSEGTESNKQAKTQARTVAVSKPGSGVIKTVEKVEITETQSDEVALKIYEKFKLNVKLDAIISNLFLDNDNGLASLGLHYLSIKSTTYSNETNSYAILLSNVHIDDKRPYSQSIRKRYLGTKETVKKPKGVAETPMLDITALLKENDTFAKINICGIDLIMSIDFMTEISDFFLAPIPDTHTDPSVKPKGGETYQTQQDKCEVINPNKKLQLIIHIEEPDIILTENLNDVNTNAIVLNAKMDMNYRVIGSKQVISGEINDLKMYMCSFMSENRDSTKHYIIHPCVISLHGSPPDGYGLHMNLIFSEIIINISPGTIELINKALNTINTQSTRKTIVLPEKNDYSKIWEYQSYEESDFWFFKCDEGIDALTFRCTSPEMESKPEKCIIEMKSLIVVFETGMGYYTAQKLFTKMNFNVTVSNWSAELNVNGDLTLSTQYYNSELAVWEPLIEPNERYTKTGEVVYDPWDLSFSLDITPQRDENDEAIEPLKKIIIHSEKVLQIVISKTSLELLQSLGAEFSEALEVSGLRKPEIIAPYIVENDTGSDITLHFSKSIFTLHDCHTSLKHKDDLNKSLVITGLSQTPFRTKDITSCTLQRDGKVYLQTKQISEGDEFDSEPHLYVQISDLPQQIKLPVSKAVTRYYCLNEHAKQRTWGIVSEVTTKYGTSKINIHGIVVVHNHFSVALSVHRYVSRKQDKVEVGIIAPGESFNVPLYTIYGEHKELYFSLKGYDCSVQGIKWNEEPSNPYFVKQLQCDPLENFEPFYMNAIREKTEIYHENTNKFSLLSSYFTIHLRPPLCLRNCLPVEIKVSVAGCSVRTNRFSTRNDVALNEKEDMLDYGEKIIYSGNVLQLPTFRLRKKVHEAKSYLVVRIINYLEKDWSCTTEIPEENLEFEVWNFSSYDSVVKMEMNLGVWFENYHGSQMLTVYSPFWMINKTGLMLSYKSSMEPHNILYHPPEYNGPILFSFRDQNFFDRKRAFVRIDNGEWSERIPLEVAGSIGSITCGLDGVDYQIGVHNHLSSNTLTKQITFLPFYTIHNKCDYDIEVQSPSHPMDPWIQISSNQCVALWPKSKELLLVARVLYTKFHSIPFLYSEEQCILLKLEHSKYGAINVDVHTTEGGVFITMSEYNPGDAPGLFINNTSINISFKEEGNFNERLLKPKQQVLFTWSDITNAMKVLFKTDTDSFDTDLKQDGIGNVLIGETNGYWVSFLDGLQRVILITDNGMVAHNAECSAVLQKLTQSIEIRLQGIGFSLINNIRNIDILYVGILNSTANWESRKFGKTRFKQMKATQSAILEANYKQYMLNKEGNVQQKYYLEGNKVEIDFDKMILLKSPEYEIQRTFYPGVFLTRKTSPFQTQFHVKINRIQIDNQILECIFPVILAPIAPPKSVADTSAKKPFIEFSVVKRVIPHSNIEQYKYLNMLMQTFYIKVDLLFINAIAEMFSTELTDEQAAKLFNDNVLSIEKPLSELVKSKSQQDQKNFYDNLHLGPLKMHLSFSMAGADTKSLPPILSTIVESVGVTLTDVNDVVFKLAYFQREYKFLTQTQLKDEITAHYTGQALKQLYVLVLGLDVLGDPYGLVVGLKKGVEDLFYEPFQGAIQGPGEFAEGLVLGVKSLFGHTVGGAAGAVSKITGAMGTCLATLTFDEEYKKKRRQATNTIPRNFNQGIARSGKDLVMGVVDGVTGVFTKPVAGARDQGFGGFFKGLGQGAIGLVARPTAGVVDFASESFDAVKRATSDSQYTHRLRPSRHFSEDGVVRPYCTHLANGNKLLKEIDKGKYAHTDIFQEMYETRSKAEYLLISNNRIMEIHKNNIYGTFSIKWTLRWPEIDSIVQASNAIHIIIKRENKLRAFSQDKKVIPVPDPDRREKLRKCMEDLRTRI